MVILPREEYTHVQGDIAVESLHTDMVGCESEASTHTIGWTNPERVLPTKYHHGVKVLRLVHKDLSVSCSPRLRHIMPESQSRGIYVVTLLCQATKCLRWWMRLSPVAWTKGDPFSDPG